MTSDERVEAALRELGGRLEVPEPPAGLAAAVLARLDEPVRRPAPRVLPRLVAAAVALLVALALAMAVSPAVRAAVLDFLVGGVEIHYSPPPVAPTTSDVPQPGERDMSLEDARAAVRFDIRVPALLGDPDSVRVIDSADGVPRVVSLRYPGARVDEFGGRISPVFEKFLHAGEAVRTDVDGAPAIWIPAPHPVIYVDEHGVVHEEAARLAARTLIWEERGLTYRIEGDLTREQAIVVARSLR
ncbi:MAG TPA: hypothetical protein VH969_05140 [Actinophytocola sp.]|uniref:hypothetical protein n=1 Tax=Actinophytocola sp. TaxID=1872138 RepID=UPI002F958339